MDTSSCVKPLRMPLTKTETSSGDIVALSFKSAPAQKTLSTSDRIMTTRAGLYQMGASVSCERQSRVQEKYILFCTAQLIQRLGELLQKSLSDCILGLWSVHIQDGDSCQVSENVVSKWHVSF